MRVACVLYGQPRDYLKGHTKITNYFLEENVTVDFFYHCWTLNTGEKYKASPWRKIDDTYYNENMLEQLNDLYKPISCEYENQSEVVFDESNYKDTLVFKNTQRAKIDNINNTLYQLYSRNKARNLLDQYIKRTSIHYDLVVMTRFDIGTMPDLRLSEMDVSRTYISNTHFPRKIIADMCIIAPVDVFLEWFNIYEELTSILDNRSLLEQVQSFRETIDINPEELIFAKYILHYKNMENISYFKGGVV